MMKFQAALSTGVATLLVVPAVTMGGNDLGTLRDALTNTNRALELLGGIQGKFETGETPTPGVVAAITEAPMLDARRRDERLVTLRNEVSLLQTELELLEDGTRPGTTPAIRPPSASADGLPPATEGGTPLPRVHTGMDNATRRALQGLDPEEKAPAVDSAPREIEKAGPKPSPDGINYTANPVLQARACFRAGLYERGATLLATAKSDPEALYWRARCYEKLNRLQEATDDLERVLETSKDEHLLSLARTDLEFVAWKKGFLEKLEAGSGGKGKK